MHELGHRMLDLEARVQLDEVEAAVRAEQELERAGVAVADRAARALGGGLHLLARLGRERGRRRLLDQLLVAPLDRALALAEREDVARSRRRAPGSRRGAPGRAPSRRRASRRRTPPPPRTPRCANASSSSSGACDEPHPLAAAARARLEQDRDSRARRPRRAPRRASSRRRRRARSARRRRASPASRAILSPIVAITSAGGPTKTRSLSTHASTNAGFSARKP